MTCTGTNETSLAQLQPPRRNRYFYGKLLDVLHLTMEQQYGISASAHLNRLNFGPGVFCGLEVTPIERDGQHGVRVEAGVVLDGLGRRIVVPDAVELMPLELTDDCGMPERPQPDALPGSLVLSICYRECEADFAPALVADPVCNGSHRCEAGTLVESYSLILREGTAAAVSHACRDEVITKLKAGDMQAALCALAIECSDVPADTCVPLATITVAPDGSLTVPDPCAVRSFVPTNRALLELIACLAQRVEECCGSTPGDSTFRVEDLAVGNRDFTRYHKLTAAPAGGMVVPITDEPAVIAISFTDEIDDSSVMLGTNVVVTDAAGGQPTFNSPPTFLATGRGMRLELNSGIFGPETYRVTVSGNGPNPVKSTDGKALDAEFIQLPSGDGTPGGEFKTTFTVQ